MKNLDLQYIAETGTYLESEFLDFWIVVDINGNRCGFDFKPGIQDLKDQCIEVDMTAPLFVYEAKCAIMQATCTYIYDASSEDYGWTIEGS